MLLWVTVLAIAGAVVALFERRLNERSLSATLAAQAALALGFFAFLLFASNPFTRLNPAPLEGRGLNPLLQDPGLAFHPPTLYLGYVGLSVAFSLAVGALVTRQVGPALARAMQPWVLAAWILLTLGITAGSYWAYYELGWGGWWFWDPVENASLMPWLAATALLHSLNVLAARGGLRAWTMMLALVAFSMSMVGTFLVRSGILTSVHAFAVDPDAGQLHPRAADALHRRRADAVRAADRACEGRRTVRIRQPRGRAGRQQSVPVGDPRHRPRRHALSARSPRPRRARNCRSARLISTHRRARWR